MRGMRLVLWLSFGLSPTRALTGSPRRGSKRKVDGCAIREVPNDATQGPCMPPIESHKIK